MRSQRTKCLTFCAIISALSITLLLIGSVFEVLDLSLAAIASFGAVLAVIEVGGIYPYLIWMCTSALSLLILPNKFPALVYLLFAGIYPILKAKFEKHRPFIAWTLKVSLFFAMMLLLYLAVEFVFKLPDTPVSLEIAFFALATVTFVLYDIAMSKIILIYIVKLRKRLGINKFFGVN